MVVSLRRRVRLACLFLGLLLPLFGASAQDRAADSPQGARRVLLILSVAEDARYSADELGFLRDSLLAALAAHRDSVAIVEWASTETAGDRTGAGYALDDLGERSLTELAFENGCDIWLAVSVDGSPDAPGYSALGFDLVTRKSAVDIETRSGTALRTRDLARRFWSDLVDALLANLETPEFGTQITFAGIPGTTITGSVPGEIELGADGSATVTVPNPNVLSWRAERRGYDIDRGSILVGDEPRTVELDQIPAARNQVDAGLATLNYLSASYARYLLPGYLFARAGFVTYLAGYSLGTSDTRAIDFISEPLSELWIELSSYYSPPDQRVRGYAGVSGGLRIVHSRDLFGLEPIAPATVGAVAGAEVAVAQDVTGWVELRPTLLIARDAGLLGGSVDPDAEGYPVINVGIGLLEILRFSIGGRYRW